MAGFKLLLLILVFVTMKLPLIDFVFVMDLAAPTSTFDCTIVLDSFYSGSLPLFGSKTGVAALS